MARRVGFSPTHGGRFAVNVVGGGVLDAPRRGQDRALRCKRHMGGNGKVAGRASPAPTDCCERVVGGRGTGGRQPAPFAVGEGCPLTGGIAKSRAGHARPLRTATNGLRTRGAREGGSPPLLQWAGVARCRVAWQSRGPGMPGPYGLLFPAAGVRGNSRISKRRKARRR